ncbi:unnamed protein product [Fraxinus pennsylvanica]|uniref:Uncharacterized protein n=1 Tax=Fraxinus pennsylvanica TaxID=56036 RepID=A0AAD2DN83_9LAMI|nr:unnamed protein product [Fraxinus pennsylvanica]
MYQKADSFGDPNVLQLNNSTHILPIEGEVTSELGQLRPRSYAKKWLPRVVKCGGRGVFGHSCSFQPKPGESKKLAKVWVAKDEAGQSGVANEKPPIDDEWTYISQKRKVTAKLVVFKSAHGEIDKSSLANNPDKQLVVSNFDVSPMLELQMAPNGTTEVGKKVEESPIPVAILNEDNIDTSTPLSNTLGTKAIDSLRKKKNGSGVSIRRVRNILLVGCSSQAIHVRVNACNGKWSCVVSVVYGVNIPVKRVDLWANLVARHGGFAYLPWVVMGDFNSVLSSSEVEGGSSSGLHGKTILGIA